MDSVMETETFELTLILGEAIEPIVIQINYSDSIVDLIDLITVTTQSLHLGTFGLCPVEFIEEKWQQLISSEKNSFSLTDNVLGIYSDLTFFDGIETQRGLKVTKTPYTATSIATHILRLRDTISSTISGQSKSSNYDPTSIAIGAGISHYAVIRGIDSVPEANQPFTTPFDNWTLDSINPTASLQAIQKATAAASTSVSVRSISVSPWSPPPHAQKLRGHLIYLVISTIEGDTFQITGTTTGFYISKSGNAHFDPSPKVLLPKNVKSTPYHSLFELLIVLSPTFEKFLQFTIADRIASEGGAEIYSTLEITHATPSPSWIVPTPSPTADPLRTQLAYLITGTTNAELLPPARDWQDEFTQFKELPIVPVAAQVLRERLISRVSAGFTQAATLGVQAIIRGEIQPLNPNESEETHTYIHNSILFTKAEDAIGAFAHLGGNEAAFVSAGKDLRGVGLLEGLDINDLNSCTNVVVDFAGKRWVAQSIIPGLFKNKEESEITEETTEEVNPHTIPFSIIYGSSTPEAPGSKLKSDKYFNSLAEKVSTGLHFTTHSTFDDEGTESQSLLNSDVHGVKGSDGRCWLLDCARLHCTDVNFLESHTTATATLPVYPHRMLLLRPELLELYHDSKLQKWIEEKVITEKASRAAAAAALAVENGDSEMVAPEGEKEKLIVNAGDFKLFFNPSAFTERAIVEGAPALLYNPEEESSKQVRNASNWLIESQIPSFVVETISNIQGLIDGFHLGELLHKTGINMRYLGIVLAAIEKDGESYDYGKVPAFEVKLELNHLQHSIKSAMVARACKHILRSLTRAAAPLDYPALISHFFNCLLGAAVESSPTPIIAPTFEDNVVERSWAELTPSIVQEMVVKEIEARYRYTLASDYVVQSIRPETLLREICLRFGIQLNLKDYHFTASTTPVIEAATTTKKGKKSITKLQDVAQVVTFKPEDVLNIYPITKSNTHRSTLPDDLFEHGRAALLQGALDQGQESIQTALAMYEQIFGGVHPILSNKFHSLGLAYHSLFQRLSQRIQFHETATRVMAEMPESEEKSANVEKLKDQLLSDVEGAKVEQLNYLNLSLSMVRQSIIISERTIGLDSYQTTQAFTDLSILELSVGNSIASLRVAKHAISLWATRHGPEHPAIHRILLNVSAAIQSMSPDISQSIPILLETQKIALKIYGEDSIPYANSLYSLSQAFGLSSDFPTALVYAGQAKTIFTSLSTALPELAETITDVEAFTKAIETAILRLQERSNFEAQTQLELKAKPIAPLYKGGRVLPTIRKAPTAAELDALAEFVEGKPVSKGKGKASTSARKRKPSSPSS